HQSLTAGRSCSAARTSTCNNGARGGTHDFKRLPLHRPGTMPELMTAPRFFHPFGLSESTTITLPDHPAHHARRVLRLREASAIILFNGQGGQYPATIHFEGKRATARLG